MANTTDEVKQRAARRRSLDGVAELWRRPSPDCVWLQASFNPPGLTVAVAKERAVEALLTPGSQFVLSVLGDGQTKGAMKQMLKPFKPGEDRCDDISSEHKWEEEGERMGVRGAALCVLHFHSCTVSVLRIHSYELPYILHHYLSLPRIETTLTTIKYTNTYMYMYMHKYIYLYVYRYISYVVIKYIHILSHTCACVRLHMLHKDCAAQESYDITASHHFGGSNLNIQPSGLLT